MKIFPFIKKTKWKLPFATSMQLAIFDTETDGYIKFSGDIIDQTGGVKLTNISFHSDDWKQINKGTFPMGYNWGATFGIDGTGRLNYTDITGTGTTDIVDIGFNNSNIIITYKNGTPATFNAQNNTGVEYTIQ